MLITFLYLNVSDFITHKKKFLFRCHHVPLKVHQRRCNPRAGCMDEQQRDMAGAGATFKPTCASHDAVSASILQFAQLMNSFGTHTVFTEDHKIVILKQII